MKSAATRPPAAPPEDPIRRAERTLDAAQRALDEERTPEREKTAPLLSVVMPVYNEARTLREIVARVRAVSLEMELIIVDDCSADGTRAILRELEQQPGVRVLYHAENRGKGAALRTGFAQAAGEVVLVQDADLEYDPRDYPKLLAPILDGRANVVYGSRFLGDEPRDPSRLHRFGNRLLTCVSNLCTGQRLTDMETCYKVFRREALRRIDLAQDRFGFEPEITAKLSRRGERIVEVPIAYHGRGYEAGKKIGLKDAFSALYCILRYAAAD